METTFAHAHAAPHGVSESSARLATLVAASAALPANRLLAALPVTEQLVLAELLEPVRLTADQVLHRPHAPVEHLYFPRGMVATVGVEGADETDAIGRDGVVGLPLVLGESHAPELAVVRIAGPALRLGADALRQAGGTLPGFRALLDRHAYATLVRLARTIACGRTHLLAPRLASLLLWLRDQAGTSRIPLTHEQVAHVLGVARRASVTDALLLLRQQGGVEVRRGFVTLHDGTALLDAACPCYLDTRAQLDRLATSAVVVS